ncbi:MAG: 4Fe-4S dicluster domain-containing protein [Chloroflexi bacterium]|nr:MAG: 4Fe-4S dicluster domain-containing protein [Chloroflexota bacterium]
MTSYRTFLPDLDFYKQTVSCQFACPVQTDARGYVNAIAHGEYERAYLIARESNPFASTCGWVCGAPCEAACRRGNIDAPVAIRALKRFVNDRYGVYLSEEGEEESKRSFPTYAGPTNAVDLGNSIFPASRNSLKVAQQRSEPTGKRVAIVGAGPAGLTCAHDLALLGHEVKIYDAASVAGGMLRMGVPEYRLPRDLIDLEIQAILALGPTLELNQALGRDFSLADLRSEYDAVFIGIGTYGGRSLNVKGEQLDGVLRAVDFLINVNLGGYNLDLGKKVVVIGGGNVAMDVARTAARLGSPTKGSGDLEVALDVARTAVRLGATDEVHCLVVEGSDEMLADPFEIEEAQHEGVIIHNRVAPKQIIGKAGRAVSVETMAVARTFDDQGHFNPELIPNSESLWDCDSVIVAIGQTGELDWVNAKDGLEVKPQGTLVVDRETMATTADGVFAGGDIAFGPRLIINAVADGQRAARSIHSHLQAVEPQRVRKAYFTTVTKKEYPNIGPMRDYLRWPRRQPPALPADRRVGVSTVEIGFDEDTAREQGERCLICTINPIFDGELCILCNGCVDVCPTDCLKLVPLEELDGNEKIAALMEHVSKDWSEGTAMLLDPRQCIRCGLCAARCPTEAVTMETFRFTEEIVFESLEEQNV